MKKSPPKSTDHSSSIHDSRLTTHDSRLPTHNSRITKQKLKELTSLQTKKYRTERGELLLEGKRLLDQIHNNGIIIKELFCLENEKDLFDYLQPDKFGFCEPWQLEKLSQTKNSQQVIALISAEKKPLIKQDFLLFLDNISEPGNLGTIFRTALALGVDGIITSPDCCELSNPKVIRSSMGAVLSLPTEERDYHWLLSQSAPIIVTCLENSRSITTVKEVPTPCILVIGSEAHGIDPQIIDKADLRLNIPISDDMESLNAAVAAGIAIFYFKNCEHPQR